MHLYRTLAAHLCHTREFDFLVWDWSLRGISAIEFDLCESNMRYCETPLILFIGSCRGLAMIFIAFIPAMTAETNMFPNSISDAYWPKAHTVTRESDGRVVKEPFEDP
jgi:hypothetical protein